MGNLLPTNIQVESKQGEILLTINLNLNIKIDSDGKTSVESISEIVPDEPKKILNKVKFEKPDIQNNSKIIEFGQQI